MDRIGVVGLSWREGGAETIGQFTVDAEALVEKLPKLAEHLQTSEVFYLSTCNRVEVGFVAEVGTPLTEHARGSTAS